MIDERAAHGSGETRYLDRIPMAKRARVSDSIWSGRRRRKKRRDPTSITTPDRFQSESSPWHRSKRHLAGFDRRPIERRFDCRDPEFKWAKQFHFDEHRLRRLPNQESPMTHTLPFSGRPSTARLMKKTNRATPHWLSIANDVVASQRETRAPD